MSIRYVTDENGKRVEDFEDARAADETRAAIERGEDGLIPFDEALDEMKRNRAK